MNWLIDWLIDWTVVRSIDWLIDGLIDWLIDWWTDWLIDWLIEFRIFWRCLESSNEVIDDRYIKCFNFQVIASKVITNSSSFYEISAFNCYSEELPAHFIYTPNCIDSDLAAKRIAIEQSGKPSSDCTCKNSCSTFPVGNTETGDICGCLGGAGGQSLNHGSYEHGLLPKAQKYVVEVSWRPEYQTKPHYITTPLTAECFLPFSAPTLALVPVYANVEVCPVTLLQRSQQFSSKFYFSFLKTFSMNNFLLIIQFKVQ